ncbi:MAG: inverse autotransporter beta domain-containing protein [Verrucomicrobia bacterium]|nr:inverse autotransporter beta domain-containing protein [Verrucomicrobiota bacterium]
MNFLKAGLVAGSLNFFIASHVDAHIYRSSSSSTSCEEGYRPYRVTARHIEPKGIGYSRGYTTLEGFFSLYNGEMEWVPFLDIRGHVFNNGKPAVNAGAGVRYLASDRVWGINTYYDYRNTKHQNYNQVALGLESLGCVWDFRINGYLPVGKKQSSNYGLAFERFEGNTAILRQKYEYALGGFNGEAAAHIDYWKAVPLYFAAGPYYLTGKGTSTWGGQARGSIQIDYLKLDANVSYDHLFKWIGQGQVGLSFSFGAKKRVSKQHHSTCGTSIVLSKRSYQPVDRFEIIPVDNKHTKSSAINPATGLAYEFIFVDNTSSSLGTFESPYHSLTTAEANSNPYDIIYIFPGDGTTTGLDQGITLKNYQKLWGSGVTQTLSTSLGSVTIAKQSNSTYNGVIITPILTNPIGSVVTVANGNEIAGLFLQNQGSNDCITATDINNLTVLNATLTAANAPGAIGINASGLSGTLTVSSCNINQATNGILLENNSGSLIANVSNTIFSSSGGSNAAIQWALSNAAEGNLNISYCTATTRNNAVEVDLSDTSSIVAVLNDNTFNTASNGVYINSTGGETSITANINKNKMTTYYQSVWVAQTGRATIDLSKNHLLATSEPTFEIDVNTGSTTATLTINGNTLISDDNDNIYLNQIDGNLTADITDNDLKGLDYGVNIHSRVASDANIHTLTISKNTLSAGNNAIEMDQGAGSVNVSVNDNTISALYDTYAFYWNLQDTPTSSSLNIDGNIINSYIGLYVYQSPSVPYNLDIAFNNNIVNATATGVDYRIINESTNNLSMYGNTISGFTPIEIEHNIGSINATINNNTLTAAGSQALYYNVNSFGSITEGTVNATENVITAAGFGGSSGSAVYLYLHATGPITTNFTDNTFNGDAYGVTIDLGGATHTMNLSNNVMTIGGGYNLIANSGSGYWQVNGNQFTALNSSPVTATAQGGDICMQLNNNTAYPTANAYNLTMTSGSFTINPPQGNIGEITETGTTTGTCP